MAKDFFSKQLLAIWRKAAEGLTKSRPPLSYAQAIDFFDTQAARDDLALGYPHEACFARNHLMCEAALKAGYMPEKAWAHDEDGKTTLKFTMPNGIDVRYWCHTATALPVQRPQGEIVKLVFDPALFDGPVSLREWGAIINAVSLSHFLEIKRLGKPSTNYSGDYDTYLKTAKALADSNNVRHPLQTIRFYQPHEIIPRTVFASQYCREVIFPAMGQWPVRQGNGWTSVDPFPRPPSHVPPGGPGTAGGGRTGGLSFTKQDDNEGPFFLYEGLASIVSAFDKEHDMLGDMQTKPFTATIRRITADEGGTYASFEGMSSVYAIPSHLAAVLGEAADRHRPVTITTNRHEILTAELGPSQHPLLDRLSEMGRDALARLRHPLTPGAHAPHHSREHHDMPKGM